MQSLSDPTHERLGKAGLSRLTRNIVIAAVGLGVVGVVLIAALAGRMVGVDQSYLMLIAQEYYLGRAQYSQIYDIQPPAGIFIHLPAIILFRMLGLPVMEGWNIYMVALSALSAYLFVSRAELSNRPTVLLIWFACMALGFDDHLLGQRDFFFAAFWFPYLIARLSKTARGNLFSDFLLGLLLSVIVCAKPPFALFIALVDVPILLLCRRQQSIVPFVALIAGGALQFAHFFLFRSFEEYSIVSEKFAYYTTVGYKLYPSLVAFFGTSEIYVLAAVIVGLLMVTPRKSLASRYVIACGATGLITFVVGILQGHPRNYYFIPVVLAAAAAALFVLFQSSGESTEGVTPTRQNSGARYLAMGALLASVLQIAFMEGGAGRALLKKYAWGYPDTARIGQSAGDVYIDWVQKHVPKNEEISVIALQYGTTSAWDPILSTLRLGRRINSYAPVIQFPLRAALVSGDSARILEAWERLKEEITSANADWVIVRRTAPEPLEPDFISLIKKHPRFYDWLVANYPHQEQFGEYVAFRRARK